MITKGQIVEIPANAPLYSREIPAFTSKKEMLIWQSQERFYSLFDGFLVGDHPGVDHFKLGQRKGIKVGGKKAPLYVIEIDRKNNRLFVGAGEKHPGLWTNVLSFPKNLLEFHQNEIVTEPQLENGIPVEVLSSVFEPKIPAILYVFDETGFLEFQHSISIVIIANPIRILYKDTLLANTFKYL